MSFNARFMFFTVLLVSAAFGWAQESDEASKKDESELGNYLEIKVLDLSLGVAQPHILSLFEQAMFEDLGFQGSVTGLTVKPEDPGLRITEGVRFNKRFSLEGSLTYLGDTSIRAINGAGEVFDLTALYYGGDIQAIFNFPITKSITAFGKAGLSYWQADTETVGYATYFVLVDQRDGDVSQGLRVATAEEDASFVVNSGGELMTGERVLIRDSVASSVPGGNDNGFEEMFGLGFRFKINETFHAVFSWDRTEMDGFDTDTAALGIGFKY